MSADRHKILLADDSVTIRKVVELTFADEGIDVVSVADGDAAMVAFVADEPDLVIADVNMPGIGGYKICEIIKEHEETRHIPVILLTGSFEPFDPGEASRVGANFYFTKPFQSIRQLVEKVTDLLDTNAFEPASVPETEDIDDLYKSSFEDTTSNEAISESSEIQFIRIDDDDESSDQEFEETSYEVRQDKSLDPELQNGEIAIYSAEDVSVALGVEPEPEASEIVHSDDLYAEADSTGVFDLNDLGDKSQDRDLVRVDDDDESTEILQTVEQPTVDPFSMPVDLGDASMDDEMIETTRPDSEEEDIRFRDTLEFEPVLVAASPDAVVDPFASPVTTDDTVAKNNWADEAEGVVEQIPAFDPNSTLLRIEFADNDHAEAAQQAGAFENQVSEPLPSGTKPDAISTEMIEMIAQRVIDKLSDKVVREVALEAVPRITENMIREALDHETKK